MKRSFGIIAALVLILVSACSSDNKTPEGPTSSEATAVDSAAPDDGPLGFGKSHTLENGLVVTIQKPVEFEATADSIVGDPGEWAHYITFDVKLVNSDNQFDPSEGTFTVNDGIQEGEEMYGAAVDGLPSTALTSGREVTFKMGFGVDALDDLVLEYTPTVDGESVVYSTR